MTTLAEKLGFGPKRFHTRLPAGNWLVTVEPPKWSGFSASDIMLSEKQFERYQRWLDGVGYIEDALPDLSASEREILMTGVGPDEWDREFGDET